MSKQPLDLAHAQNRIEQLKKVHAEEVAALRRTIAEMEKRTTIEIFEAPGDFEHGMATMTVRFVVYPLGEYGTPKREDAACTISSAVYHEVNAHILRVGRPEPTKKEN